MTALDELRSATVGDGFWWLLQRTIRAVAVARNVPAPEDHERWDEAAVAQTAADFLAHPGAARRLTDLATHCRSEDALRRRLQATVRNFLADRGRRTPVGRLVLRLNEVLSNDDRFERRGRTWAIAGTDETGAAVDIDALVAASAAVEIVVPAAWATGTRQGPDIDAPSVVRVVEALLDAAGGPLSVAVMAQVTARRLGLGSAPLSLDATAFDPPERPSPSADTTGSRALMDLRADEVFEQLNDHERLSLGLPALPVAKLGPVLGMSGSSAAVVRKRAVVILREALENEEDGQDVADAVLERARTWTESWMAATNEPY
ncbi:MAG: hypothetical protein R2761_01285 [Acidimicrobiales bacterium]